MEIKVLGVGCAKCKKLYEEAEKAVAQSGVEASVTKVEEIAEIQRYGVLMTPALVVGGEVKCAGRIPPIPEMVSWITTASTKEG
jgi:small redox-active disulfide protein 2